MIRRKFRSSRATWHSLHTSAKRSWCARSEPRRRTSRGPAVANEPPAQPRARAGRAPCRRRRTRRRHGADERAARRSRRRASQAGVADGARSEQAVVVEPGQRAASGRVTSLPVRTSSTADGRRAAARRRGRRAGDRRELAARCVRSAASRRSAGRSGRDRRRGRSTRREPAIVAASARRRIRSSTWPLRTVSRTVSAPARPTPSSGDRSRCSPPRARRARGPRSIRRGSSRQRPAPRLATPPPDVQRPSASTSPRGKPYPAT